MSKLTRFPLFLFSFFIYQIASAQQICTSTFSSSDFSIGGSATVSGSIITMTPASANKGAYAWNKVKLDMSKDFSVTAKIRFTATSGISAADGIAFVLQPLSSTSGTTGSGLGYGGITPSIAVEWDVYNNGTPDISNDHIAIIKNGAAGSWHTTYTTPYQDNSISNGSWHTINISWTASTNNLQVSFNGVVRQDVTHDFVTNVFSGNPMLYWGFTSSTGNQYCLQELEITQSCFYPERPIISYNNGTVGTAVSYCTSSPNFKLTSTVQDSYQWKKDGVNIPGATSRDYILNTSGSYSVEGTKLGITTTSDPVAVTAVAPIPAYTVSGPFSLCVGGTAAFTTTGTGGIWSSATPAVATVDQDGVVTGISAGTSYIYYKITGTPCANGSQYQFIEITATNAGTISGTQNICVTGTTTFTSNVSGGTWSSSDDNIATVDASTGVITGVAAGTATITYTKTAATGCSPGTATRTVTVSAPTDAGTLSGTQSVCAGATTTFSSTVSGGTWTSSDNAIATINSSTGLITGVSAGTATMTYTVAGTGGCSASTVTRTVTVTAAPSAGVLSGTQTICASGTTTFSSTESGGSWSTSDAAVATVDPNTGVVTAVSLGTATITYTVSSPDCPDATATRSITVTNTQTAGTLSGTQAICVGGTSNFSSTSTGGTWSSSDASVATVDANTGVVTGVAAGTATMTYTIAAAGGCSSASDTRTVTVTAAPDAGTLSGGQSICVTGTTTFTSTISGGSYTSSNTSVATVDASTGEITGLSAGTSTITYTVTGSGGCNDATATRTVTVTTQPTAGTLSGTQAICVGGTSNFSSTSTGGTWSSSDASVATVDANTGVVTGVAAGTATMTYTIAAAGGCAAASDTRTVTVTAAPDAGTLSGGQSICITGTTTISSTVSGGTYTSSNTSVATVDANTGVVTGLSAGTTTITYTVTGSGGCGNATATRSVTVTTQPTAGTLSGTQAICVGGTSNFSSTTAGGTWSSSDASVATVDANTGVVSGVAAGTATMTYLVVGSGGCADATATRMVTVTAPPSAGTISGGQEVCVSLTTGFSSTVSGGVWSSSNASIATIDAATGLITGISAGTATMTYTVAGTGGCSDATATRMVTVSTAANPGTISGTQTICISGNSQLSATVAGGSWSSSNTGVVTVNASGLVTGIAAGTANIIYTVPGNGGCAPASTSLVITVNPTPTVNAISNQTICNGASTASVSMSGAVTGTVYNWTNDNASIGLAASGTGNIGSFSVVNTGTTPVTATITVTPSYTNNGVTCTGTATSFTITVNPTPTVNAISNQTLCNGASATAVSMSGAVTGTVYSWTNNNASIGLAASGTGNIGAFSAVNTGSTPVIATITVTPSYTNDGVTCTGTSTSFTITVNPTPTVNAISNQTLCNGASTTSVSMSGAVTGTVYNWTNSNASIGLAASGTGNIGSFSAVNTGTTPVTATITVTPSYTNNGVTCTGTSTSFTITVNPTPTVNAISNQVVCDGASSSAVTLSGPVSGTTFMWSSNNTLIGIAANGMGNISSFTAVNNGSTPVIATITVVPSANGCTGTSRSFTITVNPKTPVQAQDLRSEYICVSDGALALTGSPLGGAWSGQGVSGSNLVPGLLAPGGYTLTYSYVNNFGCTSTASTTMTIYACPERDRGLSDKGAVLYPNPLNAAGPLNIKVNSTRYTELRARIYNDIGQLIADKSWTGLTYGQNLTVDLRQYPSAFYMVQLSFSASGKIDRTAFKILGRR